MRAESADLRELRRAGSIRRSRAPARNDLVSHNQRGCLGFRSIKPAHNAYRRKGAKRMQKIRSRPTFKVDPGFEPGLTEVLVSQNLLFLAELPRIKRLRRPARCDNHYTNQPISSSLRHVIYLYKLVNSSVFGIPKACIKKA